MNDWHLVGRTADPTPGDVDVIKRLEGQLRADAAKISEMVGRLRRMAGDAHGAELELEGKAAPELKRILRQRPPQLEKLGKAYERCANALGTWVGSVIACQGKSRKALKKAQEADRQLRRALAAAHPHLKVEAQKKVEHVLRGDAVKKNPNGNHIQTLESLRYTYNFETSNLNAYDMARSQVDIAIKAERDRAAAAKAAETAFNEHNAAARKFENTVKKILRDNGGNHKNPGSGAIDNGTIETRKHPFVGPPYNRRTAGAIPIDPKKLGVPDW